MHGAQEAGDVVERRTLHAAEQDRSDVAPRREQWRQEQSGLDADRQIFIDEAWAKTNMTRLRGRAPRGQRRIDKTRTGTGSPPRSSRPWAWEACAVQRCGMVRSTATYSRPSSGRCLCQDCVLAPWTCSTTCRATRRSTRVGSSSHAGPVWSFCPPPYSPDLNPIEMVPAKIKQLLRSTACRRRDSLWKAMLSVIDGVTPSDAVRCFRHRGYSPGPD